MYRLRSIDPVSGFARDFDLEEDGPVLIGRLSSDGVHEHLKSLINDFPSEQQEVLAEDIGSVRYTITMKECKIEPKTVSRVHCMIFPGGQARIVDLFSTNGTVIARKNAGLVLKPGELTNLFPGDLILLSRGRALFHYIGPIPLIDASAHPPG